MYSETHMIPLEIAAEKFVKKTNHDSFFTHCREVYSKYYEQIWESVETKNLSFKNIAESFAAVFEIRVFRFAAILFATLKGSENFEDLKEKLYDTVELLNSIGTYSKSLTAKLDKIIETSDLDSNEIDDYLKIANSVILLSD